MPVTCPYCDRVFPGDKLNARHLSKCNPSLKPKVPPCLCGHESTSLTQMKRHRKTCEVWQSRDKKAVQRDRVKATSLERYGVEDASQAPAVVAQRAATNKKRYGAENPFSRDATTFQKVQESLEGKRPVLKGRDNPFAKPEVKEKIRAHWQQEYGVNNPQQVPEIRAATKATNLERYGGELLGSPVLGFKAWQTNCERYGDMFPQRTAQVKEKARQTNQERYGVDWTCQDPEVRRKQLETMEKNWGSHFFASDKGKEAVRDALVERYGVEFPGAIEGHWDKAVKAFRERYGVDHPLQSEEFREKQRQTNIERHGTPFPGLRDKGPNLLERRVGAMCPQMMFTGDGSFWKRLPLLGSYKNPDFILPGPDPAKPKKGVTKVVEVFGDFWHSRMFTGKAPFDHEQELIDAFAEIGISCLVLWESEVKSDPAGVAERVQQFVEKMV